MPVLPTLESVDFSEGGCLDLGWGARLELRVSQGEWGGPGLWTGCVDLLGSQAVCAGNMHRVGRVLQFQSKILCLHLSTPLQETEANS